MPPEEGLPCVLLKQGSFSWQGPGVDGAGASEGGAAKGSLLLHGLDLHIAQVPASAELLPRVSAHRPMSKGASASLSGLAGRRGREGRLWEEFLTGCSYWRTKQVNYT